MNIPLPMTDLEIAYNGNYKTIKEQREQREMEARKQREKGNEIKFIIEPCINTVIDALPNYEEPPEDLHFCIEIKPYDKLRVVKGILQVDTRKFQMIKRKISGDSRQVTYEHLNKLMEIRRSKYKNLLDGAIAMLMVTYAKDSVFIEKLNSLRQKLSNTTI